VEHSYCEGPIGVLVGNPEGAALNFREGEEVAIVVPGGSTVVNAVVRGDYGDGYFYVELPEGVTFHPVVLEAAGLVPRIRTRDADNHNGWIVPGVMLRARTSA
jgi:hypothetical protein